MSLIVKSEDNNTNPAELLVMWSQKGLYFITTDDNGENEFHNLEYPFHAVVLESANYFNTSGKNLKVYHKSTPFKNVYGEAKTPITMFRKEGDDGRYSPMDKKMTLPEARKFAEDKPMRRGDILYCWNEELGLFRIRFEGMASSELYLARTGVNDYEFEQHGLRIDGGYEKPNPQKKEETLHVPSITLVKTGEKERGEALQAAKAAGLIDYLLENLHGQAPGPDSDRGEGQAGPDNDGENAEPVEYNPADDIV